MSSFFLSDAVQGIELSYNYNPLLVGFSIVVAIISSVLALQVAGLSHQADRNYLRQFALVSGSLALGGGIWSMHFIGMLAVHVGVHIHYDPLVTLASIIPSVFASWVALQMLANERIETLQLVIGGTLVGAGIGAMHYSGMMAMNTEAVILYEPYTFALSIIAAVCLAIFALWVKFKLSNYFTISNVQTSVLAGSIMGVAITAMHYIGMAASRMLIDESHLHHIHHTANHSAVSSLVLQIGATTVTLSLLVFVGNLLLRYREVNEQLSTSESRIRAIVETAVDGIISIDGRGRIIAMNGAAQRLFGWKLEEVIDQNINILMPEPFHSEHDGYLENFFKTGNPRIIGTGREVVAKRKDGSLVPIRLAVGKADIPGQHLFVGFVSDISERITMEREIRARETQYRTLISNIPGVAFRCEAKAPWKTLFISDAITTLSGWTPELFTQLQLSLEDICHPDDADRVKQAILHSLETGEPYTIEFRIIDRDNFERWVSQSACVVKDPDAQTAWIDGVIIDITETKKRNAEFEGIVRSIGRSLLFVEFDLNGRVLNANENFSELIGYTKQELQLLHHTNLICSPDEHAFNAAEFWRSLLSGEFQMGEYCLLGNKDRRIWIQATFNPILNGDGKPWKIVALGNDLSHRKAMETDLFIAKNKAEQAANAKGLFLANMSHEIRTPMNAILGFTDLLLDSELNDQQKRHLKTIAQSARSLLGLLNDILDAAKLERGALDLDINTFSLRDLTHQVMQEQLANAQKKTIQLHIDYPRQIRDFVEGDVLRLKQILVNLVGNAVKFTEQGEVILRVRERGDNMVFKIVDSGIGIPGDRLAHIFTPFTQADASMARRFGGTGLGTTIARQLAELMNGTISAASVEGKGSTFTVDIPLPASSASRLQQEPPKIQLPPMSFLIADDVPENIELLEILLRREGHQVVSANDGTQAFELFKLQRFDVVLMDIQMPVMDGLQSTRMIRAWEQERNLPSTPVIALTASVLERDRKKAADAGMNGFASKPVNLRELYSEIASNLGLDEIISAQEHLPKAAQLIDWETAVARWGDRETLIRSINKFVGDLKRALSELRSLSEAHLAQSIHRFKGASANLGLNQTCHIFEALEQQSIDLTDGIAQLHSQLTDLTQILFDQADQEKPDAQPKAQLSSGELAALFKAFRQGAIDDELLARVKESVAPESFQVLQQAVDDFDLDAAAGLVETWLNASAVLE